MYNVISGTRRSGTSLLMLALRQSGIPVVGLKYKDEFVPNKKVKDGNPNGYWELGGITTDTGLTSQCKDIGIKGDLFKVMTECLSKSDPNMVNKVIMVFRKPSNVLYSILKNNIIAEPELFIIQNMFEVGDSLDWCKFNNIPVKIVIYENLISNPLKEFTSICEFLGNGDPVKASNVVDKKLNRSKNTKCEGIGIMNTVYKMAKNNDIDEIIKFKHHLKNNADKLLKKYDNKTTNKTGTGKDKGSSTTKASI